MQKFENFAARRSRYRETRLLILLARIIMSFDTASEVSSKMECVSLSYNRYRMNY